MQAIYLFISCFQKSRSPALKKYLTELCGQLCFCYYILKHSVFLSPSLSNTLIKNSDWSVNAEELFNEPVIARFVCKDS